MFHHQLRASRFAKSFKTNKSYQAHNPTRTKLLTLLCRSSRIRWSSLLQCQSSSNERLALHFSALICSIELLLAQWQSNFQLVHRLWCRSNNTKNTWNITHLPDDSHGTPEFPLDDEIQPRQSEYPRDNVQQDPVVSCNSQPVAIFAISNGKLIPSREKGVLTQESKTSRILERIETLKWGFLFD